MTEADRLVTQFSQQQVSPPDFINGMLDQEVIVISASANYEGFDPLSHITAKDAPDAPLLPVFSSDEKAKEAPSDDRISKIRVPFRQLLEDIPDSVGLIFNLGEESISMSHKGVARVKSDISEDGRIDVPAGMSQLFAEDSADQATKPWWKFW